jgi:3-methylcrotonyl-CoA carboxylase alpha subunit
MGKRLHLTLGDDQWTAEVSADTVTLEPGDEPIAIAIEPVTSRLRAISPAGEKTGNAVVAGDSVWVTVDGEVFVFDTRRRSQQDRRGGRDQAAFTAPMPATVVRIAVTPGQGVHAGDVLISLEAMKMELPIRAPRDGVVRAIHCREGELVQPDQSLLDFE